MPQQTIKILPTLKAVWQLYRECFSPLIKFILPLLILAEVASLIAEKINDPSATGLIVLAWCISSFADIQALKLFLSRAGCQTRTVTSFSVFFLFLFVTFYIDIASTLAGFAFVVPALLIYSSAILAPAFIVSKNHGPFEAIAESVDQTKGNVWRISGLLLLVWLPLLSVSAILGFLSSTDSLAADAFNFVFSIAAALLGLLSSSITAVIYAKLAPETSPQNNPV